jgi:predicted dehydrogenase
MKIGLLGAGHLGKIHLKCLLATQCWDVVGFTEPNDAVAASVTQQYGVPHFDSLDALLKVVDAVDIVVPTPAHFAAAATAIRANKHVFIEKPVTQTVAEARKLLHLLKKHPVKVQVGHVERFNPAMLALEGIAVAPMFIESHRLHAFQPRGTDVSVILDLMIHDLDLILHLIPYPVKKVSAGGTAVLSKTPDIANARIEFENGAVANLTASRISLKQMRKMRLFQKDHYISLDFFEKNAQIIRLYDQDAPNLPDSDHLMEFDTNDGKKWLQMTMPEVPPVNAIQRELETFHDSIVRDIQPVVPLQHGFKALELAHRILKIIEQQGKK